MRRFVWPVAEYLEASRPVKEPGLNLLPVRLLPSGNYAGNLPEIGDAPFCSVAHQGSAFLQCCCRCWTPASLPQSRHATLRFLPFYCIERYFFTNGQTLPGILTAQPFSLRSGQRAQPLARRVDVNAEWFFQHRQILVAGND